MTPLDDPSEDASMTLRQVSGQMICTKRISQTLAEMLIEDLFGEKGAKLPFEMDEENDRWVITEVEGADFLPHPTGMAGRVQIVIQKANCRVVKFVGLRREKRDGNGSAQ